MFEDDGESGYFYALDLTQGGNPIVDTVNIYHVALVADRFKHSVFKIAWSLDGQQALLVVNDHVHAVFDFATSCGYCRTGLPEARGRWQRGGLGAAPRFLCNGPEHAGERLYLTGAE